MSCSTPNRTVWIASFLIALFAATVFIASDAEAQSSYFSSRGCVSCHPSPTPATCNGCHRHGANGGLSATTNKTTYAPGETVTVTLTASGSRTGWIRAILYRDNVEVARSTGDATGGMGGGAGYPITFNTPAPTTPGTYSYVAAWFGNTANSGSTHGEVRAAARSITVSAPIPTDTTPPTVSSTGPANSATNINPATAVTATFSEAVSGVSGTTFYLRAAGSATNVPATVSLNAAGTTATLQPSGALAYSTTYTATVTTGVRDAASNAMAANYSWSFTTGVAPDTTAPTVTSMNPAANATNVAVNASISATFSENILPSSATTSSFTVAGVTGTVSVSGATATFTPSAPLAYATTYTATLTTGIRDLASNSLAASRSWTFATGAAPDTAAPAVSSTAPVSNATAVPVSSAVTATFSEAMNASTITTANFRLAQGAVNVPGTVTLAGNGTTATFQPSAPLAFNTVYTATVTTGVRDLAGNAMAANRTWSFTTGTAPDTTAPSVVSVSPAANAAGVSVNSALTANFSEAVNPLTVTGATFTLRNGSAPVAGSVSASGGAATFQPSAPLANGTTYTATLTIGIKDPAGNALASPYSWSFTTGAAADTTPPAVAGTSPAGNATNVPVGSAVTATFSEALDASTVTTATFTLKDNTAAAVAGTVTVSGTTVTFAHSALAAGTRYTALLTTGIKDAAGNAMAQEHSWSFTTASAVQPGDGDDDDDDRDGDGSGDDDDDDPDDDRRGSVRDHRHHRRIRVDASENDRGYLRGMRAVLESAPEINQTGKPAGYDFPYGLVEYNVEGIADGSTVRVKLTFPENLPEGSKVYRVDSAGYTEYLGATISGNTVTLSLTDGGDGDRDLSMNGVIADPVGVAVPTAATPESSSGCSVAGGGDPTDFSGVYGALMFAGMIFLLRGRARGKASVK
ncbi:MAG: Ig-like domain-containing protein [Thermodesulfobacteriota bacterium]